MKKFLFVIGQGRSGTTALVRVVGAHDQIVMGIERFKRLCGPQGDIGAFGPGHFSRDCFFDFETNLTNITPASHERYRTWYSEMARKYEHAVYVGDKNTYPFRLQTLARRFPHSKFLCIVRDVFEVAHSWQARADDEADRWLPHRGALPAVEAWNNSVATIERTYRAHPGRLMIIDHARFFGADDNTALEPMMRFLGLTTDEPLRQAYEAARRRYTTIVAKKQRALPPELVEHIHATMRPRELPTLGST